MNKMIALAMLALPLLAACESPNGAGMAATPTPAAAATASLPFVGSWDCGVSTFTFTKSNYNNGMGDVVAINKIETFTTGTYGLTMENGYLVGLTDVGAQTMTWSSPQSGDSFDCRRVS
jgi:hypothetical protein